jgi:putative spermidine/putrescine transport system substrate-binding protein
MYFRSTRRVVCVAGLALASSLVLGACGNSEAADADDPVASVIAAEVSAANGEPTTEAGVSQLADACKQEGQVNLIALPDEWANYKGILESFRTKYPGVKNPVANPDASSKDEMEAVKTLAGQQGQPDAVDVSPAIAQEMVKETLFESYKPTTAADVPSSLIDVDNNWVGSYYGIMALLTNTTIVKNPPQSFADLKKPEYKGLVALNGDPRESGAAFAAVMAASLANGGSADDIGPGVEFFAELKASGNLGATDVTKATVLSGETPISIDWSYNLPGLRSELEKANLTVVTTFPADAVYGGFYAQGAVKGSPHPSCAKLWLEHILSDEGALGYLEGGAIPARYAALAAAGKISETSKANLPPAELISQIKFLTSEQTEKAKKVLAEQWGPKVADK